MPAKCRIEAGLNLGGDGSDTVTFNNVAPIAIKPAPKGFDQTALMLMGGVARSLQIAGALESMLDISVRYSNERVAFEKKISKFQAVQHNLARLAGESAAALAAATSAADTIANAHVVRRRGVPRSGGGKNPLLGGRRKGRRDRPSGAWRDRLHHRAHPASLLAARAGMARRFRLRELLGGRTRQAASPRAAPTNCGRWWRRAEISTRFACTKSRPHMTAALRFDPIRLPPECEQAAQGSARVPRRGDRRRHLRSAQAQPRRHRRAGIFPQGRRARLARHDLAEEIWRPRTHLPRALCGDRGNARRQRADPALLRRRPAERPGAAEIRARAHQDGHPAAHLPRRGLLLRSA